MYFDKKRAVIVIPSFNEGERIVQVISSVKNNGYTNIIVIDDGSTDNSMELIQDFNVTILQHLVNRGAGAATETGLKYCREELIADIVVMIDADTQHDVDDISKLIENHLEQNADITIGNRFLIENTDIPLKNRFYNNIANVFTSIFAGQKVTDSQSGFKVFSKKALHQIILEQDKYEHCSEIFIKGYKYNLKIIDVPIRVYYPFEIKDKGQDLSSGLRTLINLLHSVLFKNN